MRRLALVPLAALVAGCTADLPPASKPASSPPSAAAPVGRIVDDAPAFPPATELHLDDGTPVVLDPVRRELRVGSETVFAGVGPTHVALGDGGRLYVTDTGGGSVLYFRTRPELGLVRRAAVPGRPYGAATDRERGKLWVTVGETNEAVQLTADGAPRIQRRFPTVRGPRAIAVDEATGTVYVRGARIQAFDGYPAG